MSDERNGHGEHPNAELMRSMGSKKGADPIPPDQYLCFRTSKDPRQRALAWVRSKTIRHKHRSPFCVDEQGRALSLSHMALDFSWDLGFASRILSQVETMKLVAKDAQGRIFLCGDVPDLIPERERYSLDCTVNLPPYIQDQINHLTPVRRAAFERKWKAFSDFSEAVDRDAIAAARAVKAPFESGLFAEFDLRKKPGKKRRKEDKPSVQLTLLTVPNFDVQSTPDSAQSADPHPYAGESTSAQPTPTYIYSEVHSSEFYTAAAASSSLPPEPAAAAAADPIAPILEVAKRLGDLTPSKARRLVRDCGGATVNQIVRKARKLVPEIEEQRTRTSIPSPIGLLIHKLEQFFHLPDAVAQWHRDCEEEDAREAAIAQRAEERRQNAARRDREDEDRKRRIAERIAAMEPEAFERLVKAELVKVRKQWPNLPVTTQHEIAERQVVELIAEDNTKAEGAS